VQVCLKFEAAGGISICIHEPDLDFEFHSVLVDFEFRVQFWREFLQRPNSVLVGLVENFLVLEDNCMFGVEVLGVHGLFKRLEPFLDLGLDVEGVVVHGLLDVVEGREAADVHSVDSPECVQRVQQHGVLVNARADFFEPAHQVVDFVFEVLEVLEQFEQDLHLHLFLLAAGGGLHEDEFEVSLLDGLLRLLRLIVVVVVVSRVWINVVWVFLGKAILYVLEFEGCVLCNGFEQELDELRDGLDVFEDVGAPQDVLESVHGLLCLLPALPLEVIVLVLVLLLGRAVSRLQRPERVLEATLHLHVAVELLHLLRDGAALLDLRPPAVCVHVRTHAFALAEVLLLEVVLVLLVLEVLDELAEVLVELALHFPFDGVGNRQAFLDEVLLQGFAVDRCELGQHFRCVVAEDVPDGLVRHPFAPLVDFCLGRRPVGDLEVQMEFLQSLVAQNVLDFHFILQRVNFQLAVFEDLFQHLDPVVVS